MFFNKNTISNIVAKATSEAVTTTLKHSQSSNLEKIAITLREFKSGKDYEDF